MTLTGANLGNGDSAKPLKTMVDLYEAWLERPVDLLALHTGANGWQDWNGSIGWQVYNHREVIGDHQLHWSIPLIPDWGATMANAARGQYDHQYLDAARKIASGMPGDGPIYIRTGWEFNATWSPAKNSAMGQADNYIGAFQNFVDAFRSVSDRFLFEWTPNVGNHGMNPADAYPGDDYVDVIGMDFYWDSQQSWSTTDPVKAWDWTVNQQYGLQWLENFAAAHGKPTAYSEWGVNSPNAAYFIEQANKWFADHNVLYANYWESNAAFSGLLQDGQYGDDVTAAFLAAFGGPPLVLVAAPPVPVVPDLPDEIAAAGAVKKWLQGTSGAETIVGTDGNDSINSGSGLDILKGGRGDDRYNHYDGMMVVENAGEGIDTVTSWAKTVTLAANVEWLYVTGNYMQTATGNDLANGIVGGTARNIINGKGGDDWLTGGGGDDIFVFETGGGHDVITDFNGGDVVIISGSSFGSYAEIAGNLHQRGADTVLVLGNGDAITFKNVMASSLTASSFMLDDITGTMNGDIYLMLTGTEQVTEAANGGIDTVRSLASAYDLADNIENLFLDRGQWEHQRGVGNGLDNHITGAASNNEIYGRGGNDVIDGGAGDDWLYGESGNDILIGGAGTDNLFGGSGADIFTFRHEAGMGVDRIRDFSLSDHDRIDLHGMLFNYDPVTDAINDFVRLTTSGSHTTLSVDVSGSGGNWAQIAVIENVTGLGDAAALAASGTLVV